MPIIVIALVRSLASTFEVLLSSVTHAWWQSRRVSQMLAGERGPGSLQLLAAWRNGNQYRFVRRMSVERDDLFVRAS